MTITSEMQRLLRRACPLFSLVLVLLLMGMGIVRAQPAAEPPTAAAPLSAEQAQRTIDILQDDKKRADLLRTLDAIAKAEPAPAPAPAPAPPPAPAPAPAPESPIPLASGGLVAEMVNVASDWFDGMSDELSQTFDALSHFDSFQRWAIGVAGDPAVRARIAGGLWRLVLAFACGFSAEFLIRRALRKPLSASLWAVPPPDTLPPPALGTVRGSSTHLLRRLPLALLRILLELLPVAAFVGIANLLVAALGADPTTKAVLVAALNAYALWRGVTVLMRAILSPGNAQLRLVAISDEAALYIEGWISRLVGIAVFGLALVDIAGLVGLYPAAYRTLGKLVLLIDHVLLVVVVLRSRHRVASWIRAPHDASGSVALLRGRLAEGWHVLAILAIVTSWILWAVELENGYASLLRFFLLTGLVLIVARLLAIALLGGFDRLVIVAQRVPNGARPVARLHPLLRRALKIGIWIVTILVLLAVWGVDTLAWFQEGAFGHRLLSATATVAFAVIAAMAVWEWVNSATERHLQRLDHEDDHARLARMRTLLPIFRSALFIVILVIVGLTALNEIGVNIAPLLAGAGIIGVAVGFGSQKLVQDVITGIFLLLENALQVGDTVTVADKTGTVEHLSIRSIRLRAGDGAVHIIPFSSVTLVTNASRGSGNVTITVTVAMKEDTDRVGQVLKDIAAEMRKEPRYQQTILGDLDLWGVDKIDAAGVTLVGQLRCAVSARAAVHREFNRRMKTRFEQLEIQMV